MDAPALRVLESRARVYRHTWRASAFTTFVNPVLFLTAMGLGLGALVDAGAGAATLEGLAYLEFLAPGLLAASAMQLAAGDSSWPVMAGMKWEKTYHAALATPVRTLDLVLGHLGWIAVRLSLAGLAFALVMAAFGAAPLPRALGAIPPAVLTGLAFAAPITAFAARLESDYALAALFRFGIVPMFLFSGTFFPITQLPGWVQPIAYATPLWHGVQLCRDAALGIGTAWPVPAHIAYLGAWTLFGGVLAVAASTQRLVR